MKTRTKLFLVIVILMIVCLAIVWSCSGDPDPIDSPISPTDPPTLTPTDTPMPTATSTPTPTPIATSVVSLEETAYFAEMSELLHEYKEILDAQVVLYANSDFENAEWLKDVGALLDTMLVLNDDVRAMSYPPACMVIHKHLLNAADYYDLYVSALAPALVALDVDGIKLATEYLNLGGAEIQLSNEAMTEFQQERGIE